MTSPRRQSGYRAEEGFPKCLTGELESFFKHVGCGDYCPWEDFAGVWRHYDLLKYYWCDNSKPADVKIFNFRERMLLIARCTTSKTWTLFHSKPTDDDTNVISFSMWHAETGCAREPSIFASLDACRVAAPLLPLHLTQGTIDGQEVSNKLPEVEEAEQVRGDEMQLPLVGADNDREASEAGAAGASRGHVMAQETALKTALAAEISGRNLPQRVKEAENELRELAKIDQSSDSSSQKLARIDQLVANFERRQKSEASKDTDLINKWTSALEQNQKQYTAEVLSQIAKRLDGLEQRPTQDKPEDLSQINKRLHNLERWHAEEVTASLRPQDQGFVSAAAFQILQDRNQSLSQKFEVVVQQHNELTSRLSKMEQATFEMREATCAVWSKQEGNANTLWAKHETYVTETRNTVKNLRENLETLRNWAGGLETNLQLIRDIGFTNGHSIKSLDSRFSNLTTEHMVRAMVQQFTIMYPYAVTAQAEFTGVRKDREMLQEVRKEGASTSLQVTKNTMSIASQKRRVEALETKLNSIVEQFKEGRDLLQSGLDEQSGKLLKNLEDQKRLHDESMSQVAKMMDNISELQRRVSKIEASSSSPGDQRTTLANSIRLTSRSKRPVNDASIESSTPTTPATQADGAGDPEDYHRGWTDPTVANGLKVQQSFHRGSESSETTSTKSNGQKRKRRRWDLEKNDRSDDETYVESKPFNSQSSRRPKASRKG